MTHAGPRAQMPSANDASLQTWQASWDSAWSALGASAPQPVLAELLQSYSEPQRHYHTLQHLGEAMGLLQPALGLAAHPGEVALALWFHDAVYQTQAKDNEARSADWAAAVLRGQGLPAEVAGRVHGLIMATCHAAQRSEEHTSELQSPCNLVCRLLLEKKKKTKSAQNSSTPCVRT